MYSLAANTARFEIVRSRDFSSRQLHTLLLMTACSSMNIRNFKVFEQLKPTVCTMNCSYTSLSTDFQTLLFVGKYILQFMYIINVNLYIIQRSKCVYVSISAEVGSRNAPLFLSAHTHPLQPEAILICHGALPSLQTSKRKLESNTFAANLLPPS
jgi:hypothetical protein